MQEIHIEKPYKFIPPYRGWLFPTLIRRFNLFEYYLRKSEGVVGYEIRNSDLLKKSLEAGHGILLTPNHCRTADPLLFGWLGNEANCLIYAMASWHLFHQSWFMSFAIQAMGGFSVNREGADRQAINTAIEILERAERPLLIFPEGTTSRTNDRLHALLDGVAFIARTAAKRRQKKVGGKVVVHPIAVKYLFSGDLIAAVDPVLTNIEERLTWQSQDHLSLLERIRKVGSALLCLKEVEYFGEAKSGSLQSRLEFLIDRLLRPLEQEWLGATSDAGVVPRVKAIRMKIMPEMVNGSISTEERNRRWRQLGDIYLAQQLACYPPDYLAERPSVDRLLETVERFEEDLTDVARVHGSLKAVIQIDDAIEVSPSRDKSARVDPLMRKIEEQLQSMLDELALESPLYDPH